MFGRTSSLIFRTLNYFINNQFKISVMKTFQFLFLAFSLLIFNSTVKAQDSKEYFIGKWVLETIGSPVGDSKMNLSVERTDGKLVCKITDESGENEVPVNRVEESENSIVIYFTSQGMEVDMSVTKKDDENVTGGIMSGMITVKGKRLKS